MDYFSDEFLGSPAQLGLFEALVTQHHLTELKLLVQSQTLDELIFLVEFVCQFGKNILDNPITVVGPIKFLGCELLLASFAR